MAAVKSLKGKTGKAITEAVAGAAAMPTQLDFSQFGKKAADSALAPVALSQLHVKPGFNPRSDLGDLTELQESIRKEGIQTPLLVRVRAEGGYWIIAGHRRYACAKKAGIEVVPVQIKLGDIDEIDAKMAAVAENSEDSRKELNPIDLGKVFKEIEDSGKKLPDIAARTGYHISKVRRCLSLNGASEKIQKGVATGQYSMIAGLELAKLDAPTMSKIADKVTDHTSAAEIKELAKKALKDEVTIAPGVKANKQTSAAAKSAAVYTWKPAKVKQAMIQQMCHILLNPEAGTVPAADEVNQLKGTLAWAFYDRGDLDMPIFPPEGSEETKDKKEHKRLMAVIAAEAKKYTPAADEATTDAAPAADAKGKGKKGAKKGAADKTPATPESAE